METTLLQIHNVFSMISIFMTEYMKTLCEITKIETKANITHRFTNPLVNLAANLQEEIADETNSDDGSKLKALFTFNENEEKRRN